MCVHRGPHLLQIASNRYLITNDFNKFWLIFPTQQAGQGSRLLADFGSAAQKRYPKSGSLLFLRYYERHVDSSFLFCFDLPPHNRNLASTDDTKAKFKGKEQSSKSGNKRFSPCLLDMYPHTDISVSRTGAPSPLLHRANGRMGKGVGTGSATVSYKGKKDIILYGKYGHRYILVTKQTHWHLKETGEGRCRHLILVFLIY